MRENVYLFYAWLIMSAKVTIVHLVCGTAPLRVGPTRLNAFARAGLSPPSVVRFLFYTDGHHLSLSLPSLLEQSLGGTPHHADDLPRTLFTLVMPSWTTIGAITVPLWTFVCRVSRTLVYSPGVLPLSEAEPHPSPAEPWQYHLALGGNSLPAPTAQH
jgi:hypothetical protein